MPGFQEGLTELIVRSLLASVGPGYVDQLILRDRQAALSTASVPGSSLLVPTAYVGTSPAPSQVLPSGSVCPIFTTDTRDIVQWLTVPASQQVTPDIVVAPPSNSSAPTVAFANGIPLTSSDRLRIRAFGNVGAIPVQFYGRVQKANGDLEPFQFTLTTNALATVFTRTEQIGPGVLLGAAASTNSGTFTNGTVNAIAELGQLQGSTFVPHTLLFRGQVNDTSPLSSSEVPVQIEKEQYGYYTGTALVGSATARAITITPPVGKRIRFTYMFSGFTNSAVVADRGYSFTLTVNGALVWANGPNLFQGANATGTLYAALDGLLETAVPPGGGAVPLTTRLSPDLIFTQPVVVTALYFNAQAGDGFGSINVAWQEW